MFKGCTEAGLHGETVALFDSMRIAGVRPSCYTFTFVLKSCLKMGALRKCEEVHCFAVKSGFQSNVFVGTILIDVYADRGSLGSARKMFDEMPVRNVVAWTAIVAAYILQGDLGTAYILYDKAGDCDVVLRNTMMSGFLKVGDVEAAREIFDRVERRDMMCWNTMLHGYANYADFEACLKFFEEMPERNVFSWNGLIAGCVRHGCFSEALHSFNKMLKESNVRPNEATLVTVLSACSSLGALDMGLWVHKYAYENGFRCCINVGNGLIDMYAKSGNIRSAIELFKEMETRDVVTWNALINGLATHGRGADALDIFEKMIETGLTPDGITFVGALSACSHLGLVEEGLNCFREMVDEYKITPSIEHYGCLVDLLGRAGLLQEAIHLVRRMPMKADCVIWSSLLGASRVRRNVSLAEIATKQLLSLQPEDAANYVALSNIYGAVGRWKDVARTKSLMREKNAEKLPGCSSVEVNSEIVEFRSSDVRHSQTKEIYSVLKGLTKFLKLAESDEYSN